MAADGVREAHKIKQNGGFGGPGNPLGGVWGPSGSQSRNRRQKGGLWTLGAPKLGPKVLKKWPKSGQERHKSGTKRHTWTLERSKTGQDWLKSGQERPKMSRDASKTPLGSFFGRCWVATWSQCGTQLGSEIDVNFEKLIFQKILQKTLNLHVF